MDKTKTPKVRKTPTPAFAVISFLVIVAVLVVLINLGVDTTTKAMDALRERVRQNHLKTTEEARTALRDVLCEMVSVGDTTLNLSTKPSVVLVIGVNGVGKTTTIGKIAH